MQWLERWVASITARPVLTWAIGLAYAALALELDGAISALSGDARLLAALGALNAMIGISALIVAGFAGHATWFRRRHARRIEAARPAPLPATPWDERPPTAPVGPTYLRSLGWSAAVFGMTASVVLFPTPLNGLVGPVLVACAMVALAAVAILAWRRLTLKAAPVASGP